MDACESIRLLPRSGYATAGIHHERSNAGGGASRGQPNVPSPIPNRYAHRCPCVAVAGIDLTIWVPIIGTWVLVVGTLAFGYWQLKQNQHLHSTSTLLDLRERYYSPRMRQARKELSSWLLQPNRSEEPDNWELGVFFELLGSLTRSRLLEKRLVRNAFGTWVTAYYTYLTQPVNRIEAWRKESNDPLIFADFEWLAKETIEFERRRAPAAGFGPSLLEEARYVLEAESEIDVAA